MVAHTHPQSDGVHSSPASVRHYQTRDYTRNNPQISVKHNAPTDRQNMMSDAINTSIPLLFSNMMKTYLPPIDSDGFDEAYPADKIKRIHGKLNEAVELPTVDKPDARRKEKRISDAWVSPPYVSLLQPTTLMACNHSSRLMWPRRSVPDTNSTSPRTIPILPIQKGSRSMGR